MDETGFQLVSKGRKVVTKTGDRNVYIRVSGERSETISAAVSGNAAGSIILPPFFIFKGESLPASLVGDSYPPMTLFACSESGYMNSALFKAWFEMMIQHLPSIRPILLLLDGHKSHSSLEVLELARKNNIIMLCFPPHTTHEFQPCDVGVFSSLKASFLEAAAKRMRKKRTKAMSRCDFGKVVSVAWEKSVTSKNFRNGFKETGLWPFDEAQITKLRASLQEKSSDESFSMNESTALTSTPLPSTSRSSNTASFTSSSTTVSSTSGSSTASSSTSVSTTTMSTFCSTMASPASQDTSSNTSSSDPDVTAVIREILKPSPQKNDGVKITKQIKFAT